MTSTAPQLQHTQRPDGPCAVLQGRWGAAELGQRAQWRVLRRQLAGLPAPAQLGWDLTGLQWLDHIGAQLLWQQWGHAWPARLQLTPAQRTLLERVAQLSAPAAPQAPPWRLGAQLDRLGLQVLHALGHVRFFIELIGQLLLDFLQLLRQPQRGPWRDFSGHLYRMG
ncbi:MAG: ABC transporter permease, partial [Comamonadaceae bacterium]|nr:ABC transporter permease [Comamonadaceae bacterium]